MTTQVTWLGASAFRITTEDGYVMYLDPWFENSDCPASEKTPERADLIVLSHGHFDHVGQTLQLWNRLRPVIVAPQDLRHWLERQGVDRDDNLGPDMGGTVHVGGISISFTDARHSGGAPDGSYGGAPCGVVLGFPDGRRVYFSGDTCVFGDMQLIAAMHKPDIAILPIGGHFTMDPAGAAMALSLLSVKKCIPCHYRYGAQPPPPRAILPGKPDHLRALVGNKVEIVAPAPGESIFI